MTAPIPGSPPPGIDFQPTEPANLVGRAMAGLDGLAEHPLAAHVAAFEQVHAALGEALAAGEG
ncbi:MAG: hypothetical protein H0X35_07455 [Pseudonocardiales bacterium]|nr:hypothetical protein [Pseudonocardiales bacterium]